MKHLILVLLLVATGCQVTVTSTDPQKIAKAELKKVEAETVERIRQYKMLQEEQQVIRDLLLLKVEIAKIQAENAPPKPQIENMKFIPKDQIPPDAKVSEGLK